MASISTRWPWSWPRSACGSMPSRSARRLTLSTKAKKRVHKGHPLCNLAIVARAIGSPTLTHHYAMLSSAGDIYWKHQEPHLQHGGYAPTMLEQFESHQQQRAWREKIENDLKSIPTDKPWYLESFLAARWFSEPYAQHFMNRAGWKSTEAGHSLKCCSIATPGFEVDSARKTTEEQVDLVVIHTPELTRRAGSLAPEIEAGVGEV